MVKAAALTFVGILSMDVPTVLDNVIALLIDCVLLVRVEKSMFKVGNLDSVCFPLGNENPKMKLNA